MATAHVEQFTTELLDEAGVSVSDRYKDDLMHTLERRIALAITERVDSRIAIDLERALVFQDRTAIQQLISRIPGIQDVVASECTIFRSEYLSALQA